MILSKSQNKVLDKLLDFAVNSDKRFISVNAGSGTGKSTLIHKFITSLNEVFTNTLKLGSLADVPNVVVTATTKDAVFALEQIGLTNVETIYSLLALTVKTDYKTGETSIVQRTTPKLTYEVVVVDEASFINDELFEFMEKAYTTSKKRVRFIMVGDAEQFLPVDYDEEEALFTKDQDIIEMSKVWRSSDPKFTKFNRKLRLNVRNRVIEQVPDKVGETLFRLDDESYLDALDHAFRTLPAKSRVLTFTNADVAEYSHNIHEILNIPDEPVPGDSLILSNGIKSLQKRMVSVSETMKVVYEHGEPMRENYKNLSGTAKNALEIIRTTEERLSHSMRIIKIFNGNLAHKDIVVSYKYFEVLALMKRLARRKKWNDYYTIKENISNMGRGFASTTHGSQGSSIDYVFLDLTNLSKLSWSLRKTDIARLLYVGITRAKKKCFVRGHVPNNLLGKF